jgi:glycosyltransferase involved in cell wall biosynthesis
MKIAVYTITKNEEQFIKRWADSCAEADYRLIVDTGSTDNTVAEAIANGCHVGSIAIRPWRFDDARNASLALIPEDIDYCIALDADEVLIPGWREAIERVKPSVTRPRYKYVWSWNPDGSEGLTYSGDKIHARHHYRWKHPVHEVIKCTGNEVQGWVDLQIHHHPDHSKSRSQYLPLLEQAVREDPSDDRNRFYLGRELMFNRRNEDAEIHLRKHLELSGWAAERATCMRYLGRVTGNKEHWLLRACGEAPDRREPWVELAQFYYDKKDWMSVLAACHRALAIKEKPLEYLCEADSWGALPHDLASIAAWHVGLRDEATAQCSEALRIDPNNERIEANYLFFTGQKRKPKVDVVIPTKSNMDGLRRLVAEISEDPAVGKSAIIGDGHMAMTTLGGQVWPRNVVLLGVQPETGIHRMWNAALNHLKSDNYVAFVNDDVIATSDTLSQIVAEMERHPNIGLMCPRYDERPMSDIPLAVSSTCRGRYDGTGGLAGFFMVLRPNLRNIWRFDERMKWWYGDDDLLRWVTDIQGYQAAIASTARCFENSSWTINNDPPSNFASIVEQDAEIFRLKWGLGA